MKKEHTKQFDDLWTQYYTGRDIIIKATEDIKVLTYEAAKEAGFQKGTIVTSKRMGQHSITGFEHNHMIVDGKLVQYIEAFGVPCTKAGVAMKRRDKRSLGAIDFLTIDKP